MEVPMTLLNYALLPVEAPLESARVYDALLGAKAVERAESFVLYVLPNGFKIGLWSEKDMVPAPAAPGGLELCFTEASAEAVDERHRAWTALGLETLQAPQPMDFGYTFVVADPDGHRLRVFSPAANPR
jgi:catechol 2,3-dioxygenase-like lactoylglutathione lyase family enzyme